MTAGVKDALRLGCAAVGFTIYPGSEFAFAQLEELRELTAEAKAAGLAVVVWSYPRGAEPEQGGRDGDRHLRLCGTHGRTDGRQHHQGEAADRAYWLEAARKVYEKIDVSSLPKRAEHIMQCAFNGKRIVLFSGGEAKDLDGVLEEIRGLRDGGASGSIIGRNTFQRPKEQALDMLQKIIEIYLSKD